MKTKTHAVISGLSPLWIAGFVCAFVALMTNAGAEKYSFTSHLPLMPDFVAIAVALACTAALWQCFYDPPEGILGKTWELGFLMQWLFMIASPVLFILNIFYVQETSGAMIAQILLPIAVLSLFRKQILG